MNVSGGPVSEEQPRPLLCVVRGTPSDEELAALTTVLAAAASHDPTDTPPPRGSAWAVPVARLRTSLRPGPGAWRASALPR